MSARGHKSKNKSFWIAGATLVTQNSSRQILKANILIENGIIAEITLRSPKAKVIDLRGKYLLPGFVQTHVHLCQTLFRNMADDLELLDWLSKHIWKYEAAHTYYSLYASASLGIYELLASGTTCILDMGTVRHTEAIFDAAKSLGIRANIGKCLMDNPKTNPAELCENSQTAINESLMLYKKWNGQCNDRLRASFAPRSVLSCTDNLLTQVQKHSEELNALVHTHASENRKEIEFVKKLTGRNNLEHLNHLNLLNKGLVVAHCVWPQPNEMGLIYKSKMNITHCPSSNLKLASGIAPIPTYLKNKVNVSLGADGAPCNNRLSIFDEMKLAAIIQKPKHGPREMTAQEVLDMATLNGAKALNWDKDIGSIEVGKKADFVALDLNSFENFSNNNPVSSIVYSTGPQHVLFTMVDGRFVFRQSWRSRLQGKAKELLMVHHPFKQ